MNPVLPFFIPPLIYQGDSYLTTANWEEVGIRAVSCPLQELLFKPGLSLLRTLKNLRSYLGWSGVLVLNALLPPATSQGYKIRSPYDGAILEIGIQSLYELIIQLDPDYVILPSELHSPDTWVFPNTISPLFSTSYHHTVTFKSFIEQVQTNKFSYVIGNFDYNQVVALKQAGLAHLESARAITDAVAGITYTQDGAIDLLKEDNTHANQLINETCRCPTCTQGLTRAYLHHLLKSTPLLCQRFLIQHNIYQKVYLTSKSGYDLPN